MSTSCLCCCPPILGEGECAELDIPVTVGPGGTSVGFTQMHASLRVPETGRPEVLLIMVPGAASNAKYWDFQYKPDVYNYSLYMNSRGYSTLTVDRVGAGLSMVPPASRVDSVLQATALSEVVEQARSGQLSESVFTKIVLVGHSMGGAITLMEATMKNNVDAVVTSGISHAVDGTAVVAAGYSIFMPVEDSTELPIGKGGPGYLTRKPGIGGPDNPDPGVVDWERRNVMDVVTGMESNFAFAMMESYSTNGIEGIPILLTIGANDPLICGLTGTDCTSPATVRATEQKYFKYVSKLDINVVAGAGHDIQLSPVAASYNASVADWLDTNV